MERGLLSDKALGAFYDDFEWLYLFQDFTGSESDRRAERIAIRFGISSWPQHLLVDPVSLRVIGDTGRTLESFAAAAAVEHSIKGEAAPSPSQLAEYDELAGELQLATRTTERPRLDLAKDSIEHTDVVVRYFATALLAEHEPSLVAQAAPELLATSHDQLRFLVCKTLAKRGASAVSEESAAEIARTLEQLLREPAPSNNPNMLRVHAAEALSSCGDEASLEALGDFAVGGAPTNMLTRTAVASIAAVAVRSEGSRDNARDLLIRSFPEVRPNVEEGLQGRRDFTRELAEVVHAALKTTTGESHAFPEVYNGAARRRLVEDWSH